MKQARQCEALLVLVLGGSLWLPAGCALRQPTPTVAAQQEGAVPEQRFGTGSAARVPLGEWTLRQYTDVPIPKGYTLRPEKSFVFLQETLRSADLTYEGGATVEELIRFYQEGMPTHGWQPLRMTGVRMKSLTFVKGGELCEIMVTVNRSGHALGEEPEGPSTQIHIKVNPR